jgi:antitoxin YefM
LPIARRSFRNRRPTRRSRPAQHRRSGQWTLAVLPVADARAQLSKLIDQAASTHERFEITRNGHRTAVLLSADDYDAMQETIAVLSDTALLAAHRDGEAAIASGDYLDADQLAHAMRDAGRGPR